MSLNISEFLEVYGTEDILDWWTNAKLPHPGCPIGFKLVCDLVLVCHRLPMTEDNIRKRASAIYDTLGIVRYEEFSLAKYEARFYWINQARTLIVPLSDDYDYMTDIQLLITLYGKGK